MIEIMNKMLKDYDRKIRELEIQLEDQKITNPAHMLYKELNWTLAKKEAVQDVLNEYYRKSDEKEQKIQAAKSLIDEMLAKGYRKNKIVESVYKTGIPMCTAVRLFLQRCSQLLAETPVQTLGGH